MKFINVQDLVTSKDWEFLVKNSIPVTIADSFSFDESMRVVGYLTIHAQEKGREEGLLADMMKDYAINLMIILREKYPKDWQKDWKNEAFLGISCGLCYREEEAFKYCKSAYYMVEDPPLSLLFAYLCAGEFCIELLSESEIRHLAQKASQREVSYEVALHFASLFAHLRDEKEQAHWEQQAIEAERKQLWTPMITPDILKEVFAKLKRPKK